MAIWDDPNILSGTSVQPTTGQPAAKADFGYYCIHQGLVTMDWALRFKMLEMPPSHIYMFNSNQPYDTARETCVRSLLDKDVKWIFSLDSVPNYTPILIRDPITHNVDVKPISELGIFNGNTLERVNPTYPYEVFEKDRWCPIKKVIRHPFNGHLKKITCRGGTIDITPNHSIYKFGQGNGASLVDVKELKIGHYLTMPRVGDWERRNNNGNNLFFAGDPELAWLYGFMVAEGSVSSRKGEFSLSNNNEDLLEKAKEIFESNYNVKMTVLTNRNYTSKIQITNKKLGNYLHDLLYTDNRDKRIPSSILNAPEKIINSFLEGFLEGDGHRNEQGYKSYANNSQTVIQGIIFLLKRLGYNYAVYTRPDKPNAICLSENVRKDDWYKERLKLREKAFKLRDEGWGPTKIGRHLGISKPTINGWILKGNKPKRNTEPKEIKNIFETHYKGYLYDLATETNKFSAGVGSFLVHNSDVIAPINAVTALMQFAQQFDFPVISGLYWAKKRDPVPMPAAWLLTGEKPEENVLEFMPVDVKPHIEKRSIIPVDVVGAGCLLVKAEIFKKLDKSNPDLPFFCWGLGRQKLQLAGGKPIPKTSEDFYFCMRLIKELNIHPQLATPVQCDHICNTTVKRGLDGQFELGRM